MADQLWHGCAIPDDLLYDVDLNVWVRLDGDCAAHGRTSKNQCVGRFLSNSPQGKRYICLPPGGDQETGCSRPT